MLATTSLVGAAAIAAGVPPALAADFTWSGGGTNGNWSNADNWTPTVPADANTTGLIFDSNGNGFSPTNDNTDFTINYFQINSGFDRTITGNPFNMRGADPRIYMGSDSDVIITNDIYFQDDGAGFQGLATLDHLGGAGTGTLIFTGVLSSNANPAEGNFRWENDSVMVTGANTYTGDNFIGGPGGTILTVANDTGLGGTTGTTTVRNGSTLAVTGNIMLQEDIITMLGVGFGGNGALRNLSGNNSVVGAITLTGATRIQSDADLLTILGGISGTNQNLTFAGPGDILVDSVIAMGTGSVTKDGSGTTTFTGANTYSGGTFLNDGTLSVSSDENLGDASGALTFDGGILQVTGTGYTTTDRTINWGTNGGGFDIADPANVFTLDQVFTGSGPLDKLGDGTLAVTGDSSGFGGLTQIHAGTLDVSGSLCGSMEVLSGGTLTGTGTVCDTTNFVGGTIAPGNAGIPGTLTIDGDYTSNGGSLEIEAVLGDDSSPTDLLLITGDTIMGTGATQVYVVNLGGLGAETTGDGIRIVQVDGTSAADLFTLGAPAIGGAYSYDLFHNGISDPDDGDWYLRSTSLAPTLPTYENYPIVLLGLTELPTLQQRVGNRYWPALGGANPPVGGEAHPGNLWLRFEGVHGHFEGESTLDSSYDAKRHLLQFGLDGRLAENDNGMLIGGINAQYGHASADVSSDTGDGSNTTDSFGLGATLTWYGDNGAYVDGQATIAALSTDLSADGVGTLVEGNDGWGYGLSIETGRRIDFDGMWSVTPQAQLAFTSVDLDTFTDPFDAEVSLNKGDSLKGRLGIAVNRDSYGTDSRSHLYGIANLTYEFLGGTSVDVAGVEVSFDPDAFGGEIGIGGTHEWADGKYAIHGEVLGWTSFDGSYGFKGTAGLTSRL